MTELQKLNQEIDRLRTEILSSKFIPDKREKHNRLNQLKNERRMLISEIKRNKNVENQKQEKIKVINPLDNLTKEKYVKLLNDMNDKYVAMNCKLKENTIYSTENGKEGFFHSAYVIPEEVGEKCGIFVRLLQIKTDNTPSKKFIRKTPKDDRGFPLEDIIIDD